VKGVIEVVRANNTLALQASNENRRTASISAANTLPSAQGYLKGAVETGERAVNEIIAALR